MIRETFQMLFQEILIFLPRLFLEKVQDKLQMNKMNRYKITIHKIRFLNMEKINNLPFTVNCQ